jgi:hypothetical protein
MAIDKSIFGLRFGGNVELYPTQEELSAFLERLKQIERKDTHSDDLAKYSNMLEDVSAFEHLLLQTAGFQDCREMIFYGVLIHSGFFNSTLKAEVEYFKYHVHSLLDLDFKKPLAFIRHAREEMIQFDPNRKESAAKLERLRSMVCEREETLDALKKRREALDSELRQIARYIRNNLVKIEKLCEASITILEDPNIAIQEESRIIEAIKAFIKEELRDVLHQGTITQQHLEDAKKDADAVSREVSAIIKKDIYALKRLYEAVSGHTKKISHGIDALLEEINGDKGRDFEESGKIFAQIEQALVSLVSDFHFELEAAETHTETAYKNMLTEKRKEMLGFLFELLQRERRAQRDRRAGRDRRKFKDPSYKGPERRSGKKRRGNNNRRTT